MDMIQQMLNEGISADDQMAVRDFFKSQYGIPLDGYVTYEEFCSSLRKKTSFAIQSGVVVKKLHKLKKAPFLAQLNTRHSWKMYFVLYNE